MLFSAYACLHPCLYDCMCICLKVCKQSFCAVSLTNKRRCVGRCRDRTYVLCVIFVVYLRFFCFACLVCVHALHILSNRSTIFMIHVYIYTYVCY